jgi:hypothetical protein
MFIIVIHVKAGCLQHDAWRFAIACRDRDIFKKFNGTIKRNTPD